MKKPLGKISTENWITSYKNYVASIELDEVAEIFHSEVINMRDVITFQGTSVKELKKAFKDSAEDYLEFCKERNEEPEKPFSDKFNLRLDPELHRQVFITAAQHHMSLNQRVIKTIKHRF